MRRKTYVHDKIDEDNQEEIESLEHGKAFYLSNSMLLK